MSEDQLYKVKSYRIYTENGKRNMEEDLNSLPAKGYNVERFLEFNNTGTVAIIFKQRMLSPEEGGTPMMTTKPTRRKWWPIRRCSNCGLRITGG